MDSKAGLPDLNEKWWWLKPGSFSYYFHLSLFLSPSPHPTNHHHRRSIPNTNTLPRLPYNLQLLHYPVTTLHAPQLVLLRLSITGKIWCNVSGSNFSALYPYIQYLTREYLSHRTLYVSHLFHMCIFHTLFSLSFFTAHAFSLSLSLQKCHFSFSLLYIFPLTLFKRKLLQQKKKSN